jgi:heme/copper-type cytochrome/quinol oxidase subunit 3
MATRIEQLKFSAQKHPFHLVDASPYPFSSAVSLLLVVCFLTDRINSYLPQYFLSELLLGGYLHLSFTLLIVTVMSWFVIIVVEAGLGYHTRAVQRGLKMGMLLFIISEIMFFFAFFWAYFHFSLNPASAIGAVWPPFSTQILDPWGIPAVNTLLLLSSGVTITLAHAYILKNKTQAFGFHLGCTVLLGIAFLACQFFEYKYVVKFSWINDIYGSIFFVLTGFHGLHVTIGTLFLLFCYTRNFLARMMIDVLNIGFTSEQHLGFEAAAWYWHFVDVVWLLLFIVVYYWGGSN